MMPVYQQNQPWIEGEYPAILAVGDSWFWYPFNNVLESIAKLPNLLDGYRNIQAVGANGKLLADYVGAGQYASTMDWYLLPQNRVNFNVFMISGGGNDAVDYKQLFNRNCAGYTDPAQCISAQGLDGFLGKMVNAMGSLIHTIRWAYKDEPAAIRPILINGYDYPIPDGRGFDLAGLTVKGPWLSKALNDAGVDPDMGLRTAVVRHIFAALDSALATFDDPNNDVIFIRSAGTLNGGPGYKTDWVNELHPTPAGFDKIVSQRWAPVLASYGMTRDPRAAAA
jgi:hypothetical protein